MTIGFLNRDDEVRRLNRLMSAKSSALVVVTGRRRIGKTRLLVEWARGHGGIYFVADESSPDLHRRYLAAAIAERLPGFDQVVYPDWRSLLSRIAREAQARRFRGPIVIDELPYLASASAELPSVLQQWLDHEGKDASLVVAVAGSSQRMMQGLVLDQSAPLFGRASESLSITPLDPTLLPLAFPDGDAQELVDAFTAWGGVPRYWELAGTRGKTVRDAVDDLVLSPMGALHDEPPRLLHEELPAAGDLRPLLDAVGSGAHRASEIAARVGRPATSLSRGFERLVQMGLVRREVPFGEHERAGKRSLYRIEDPLCRLWFRVVAPNRGLLELATEKGRRSLLARHWPALRGLAWEQLCRLRLAAQGDWKPGMRWWKGSAPEWDLVAESVDEKQILVAELRAHEEPLTPRALEAEARRLASRPLPTWPSRYAGHSVIRALITPEATSHKVDGVRVLTLTDLGVKPRRRR